MIFFSVSFSLSPHFVMLIRFICLSTKEKKIYVHKLVNESLVVYKVESGMDWFKKSNKKNVSGIFANT